MIFIFLFEHDIALELRSFSKMTACETTARARDSNHHSNHCRIKLAAGSENWYGVMICYCLNCHVKVRHKSKKAFGLWAEWHYTTRGLAYGYIITRASRSWLCIHPPISLVVQCHSDHRPMPSRYNTIHVFQIIAYVEIFGRLLYCHAV